MTGSYRKRIKDIFSFQTTKRDDVCNFCVQWEGLSEWHFKSSCLLHLKHLVSKCFIYSTSDYHFFGRFSSRIYFGQKPWPVLAHIYEMFLFKVFLNTVLTKMFVLVCFNFTYSFLEKSSVQASTFRSTSHARVPEMKGFHWVTWQFTPLS